MAQSASPARKYVVAAGFGALAGGLSVAIATKAVPRVMSGVVADMMEHMMARMGEEGRLPDT